MTADQNLPPAFGTANLSNCEREQIHLAGSIQPYGALIVVREEDHRVVQESENAASFLGFNAALAGRAVRDLGGSIAARIIEGPTVSVGGVPVAFPGTIGEMRAPHTALIHRTSIGELVVEFERGGAVAEPRADLEQAVHAFVSAASLRALCDQTAQIFRKLTGYDRVMIYRFDEEGHGEVFSETRKPDLEPFLGNRYPASDIPQIARRLYERNRVRVLADVNYRPSLIVPRLSPISGRDLDMSVCFLRSVSPIHLQYLKNMGVAATLVVSLMVGGRLWGLISCHHYSPRFLNLELRSVCELLAEVVGTRVAALESFMRGQGETAARRLEQRMAEGVARYGDWKSALFDRGRSLLLPLRADGAALLFEGEIVTAGDVPSTDDIREIARWLRPHLKKGLFATAGLSALDPAFEGLAGVASGVAAATLANQGEDMLIWFRHERVRTVTWGGDPTKPVSDEDDPSQLSPRRSFAQWHQIVKGTSDPWTDGDLRAAGLIRASIGDVIVQFRAVRILITQDQLDQVSRKVRDSEQHVLVADARGHVIENNASLSEWLGIEPGDLRFLSDLAQFFEDPEHARTRLEALLVEQKPWHGEAAIAAPGRDSVPVLMRADPVFVAPERVSGFVLLFADMTEKKAAFSARRHFQDDILRNQRQFLSVAPGGDPSIKKLMSSVVENAQLAALEITEGSEVSEVPALLDTVGASVSRAIEVLEQLVRSRTDGHGTRASTF